MNKNSNVPTYYFQAIRSIIPYATKIERPCVPGNGHCTFIVQDNENNKYMFKFNDFDIVFKNIQFNKVLRKNGISVPNLEQHVYKAAWMETYQMIRGRTLYESVKDGLPNNMVHNVYHDIIEDFIKMSQIDIRELPKTEFAEIHQVTQHDVAANTSKLAAPLFAGAVRIMNHGKKDDLGLYHCGITPKNIIVTPDGKYAGLIDMDDVAISNKNYAFGVMATQYERLGYNPNELIDMYEGISGEGLDHKHLEHIGKINEFGRWAMWKAGLRQNQK